MTATQPDVPQPGPANRRLVRAAEELRTAVRRQDGKESPVGPRAMRTRARLLRSAEALFVERGYLNTSLADVAQDAGVSLGTVYQYFADRNDVVATLAAESALTMLERGADDWDPRSGRLGLRRAVGALVTWYAENRDFFALWETASHVDERLAGIRREFERHFRDRFAKALSDGIRWGHVRPDLEPGPAATALTLMVSSYCHDTWVFNLAPEQPSTDSVTDLLTALWADAIALREAGDVARSAGPVPRDGTAG